jgi:hypothetical protein
VSLPGLQTGKNPRVIVPIDNELADALVALSDMPRYVSFTLRAVIDVIARLDT